MPSDLLESVYRYCEDVMSGQVPINKLAKCAVERHLRDLKTGHERGLYFCEDSANHNLKFAALCNHSKGEWARTPLVQQPWQNFIDACVFGWKREVDDMRRFRFVWEELPRKNGKSTRCSKNGIYMLYGDFEPGAEIYTGATTEKQARIIHGESIRMVRQSPLLRGKIQTFRDNLSVQETFSKYEPLGGDSETLDGLNTHGAFIDEVHKHKTRGMIDVLETSVGSRRQPIIWCVTTSGSDKVSVCWDLHDYAEKLLLGAIEDDSFFAIIFCADEGDDIYDELTWRKANPNFGISVKEDDIRAKAERAKRMPSYVNTFKRLHLNIWTEQITKWFSFEKWKACGGKFSESELEGMECTGGFDLAETQDLCALALRFQFGNKVRCLPYFWIPEDTIEDRTPKEKELYQQWKRDGHLFVTPGNVVDDTFIEETLDSLSKKFKIQEIGYDPHNATRFMLSLKSKGYNVVPHGQGIVKMNAPTKELENLVVSGKLEHGDHPVLTYCAANASVRTDSVGNIVPVKSGKANRIDGIIALIISIGVSIRESSQKKSIYESRGLVKV